ncbi:MAG TPA: glycosyltransferase [Baekduia sp.]|jgi:glycosyltransferase involved in cell wall biosynthesis
MSPPSVSPASVDASVLVPVLNEAESIAETVRAMTAQRFDGSIEFLFADGGSADDTVAQLTELGRADPRIRVFDNPLGGTASGLNVCLREARGEFVARMDAHTYYREDYVALGVERLRRGGTSWVAGPQVPEGRGRVSLAVTAALRTPFGRGASKKWGSGDGAAGAEYDLDTGVFGGVWRRADVLASGGWDEGWPRNQDSEMASRFLRAGERIVCVPAMGARYLPRDSLKGLWRQYEDYGSYRAKTALRHPTSLRRSALLPPLLVLDAALALLAPSRRLRRAARAGLGVYAVGLGACAKAEGPEVVAVIVTMHAAHGVGFLRGLRRWGVPRAALVHAAGGPLPVGAAGPYDGPVDAPSLGA